MCYPTNDANVSKRVRRTREKRWIRQMRTAASCDCNDYIDSMANLTSLGCESVKILNPFNRTSRRHQNHCSRKYNKPVIHDVSFDGLLLSFNLQADLRHIRRRMYMYFYRPSIYNQVFIIFVEDCTSSDRQFTIRSSSYS